jgi:hypothetical protein
MSPSNQGVPEDDPDSKGRMRDRATGNVTGLRRCANLKRRNHMRFITFAGELSS